MPNWEETVRLELDKSTAIVLFEYVSGLATSDHKHLRRGEQEMIWNIEAVLESQLAEPFLSNYSEIVDDARRRLSPVDGA